MKILLVEDDIEISAMLKDFLVTEKYEVIIASDGESACEKFFSDDFGIVLLDLMIPKKKRHGGYEKNQGIQYRSHYHYIGKRYGFR